MQNFSHLVQGEHFQRFEWMGEEIQWKTAHISETVRDMAKVTISH